MREVVRASGVTSRALRHYDAIGAALDGTPDQLTALREHAVRLRLERDRTAARIAAVEHTIAALEQGRELNMNEMFAGFDHERYAEEVSRRWGADTAKASSDWWKGLGEDGRAAWAARVAELNADWTAAAKAGLPADRAEALALAARHVEWLRTVPFAPGASGNADTLRRYVLGLGDMYVADPRFAANYGGAEGAAFVRAALRAHFGVDG